MAAVVANLAPVAPKGWPRARDPPWGMKKRCKKETEGSVNEIGDIPKRIGEKRRGEKREDMFEKDTEIEGKWEEMKENIRGRI